MMSRQVLLRSLVHLHHEVVLRSAARPADGPTIRHRGSSEYSATTVTPKVRKGHTHTHTHNLYTSACVFLLALLGL